MTATKNFGSLLKNIKTDRIATGIIAILLGLLFVTMPANSAEIICMICGVLFLVAGIIAILYFIFRGVFFGGISLVIGVIFFVVGLLCIFDSTFVLSSLAILLGIFVIIDGAFTLSNAIECARAKIPGWPALLAMALVVIALGALIMFDLFSALMVFLGIALIADGIFDILIVIIFSRKIKTARETLLDLERALKDTPAPADSAPAEVIIIEEQ